MVTHLVKDLLSTIINAAVMMKTEETQETEKTVVEETNGEVTRTIVVEDKCGLEWEYVEPIDKECKRIFGVDIGDDQRQMYRVAILGLIEAKWKKLELTPHYEGRLEMRVKDKTVYEDMGNDAGQWVKFIRERIGGDRWLFNVDVRGEYIRKVAIEYRQDKQMHRLVLGFHKRGMAVVTIIIN